MSDQIITPPPTTDNSLVPALSHIGNKSRVKFNGGCLKQDKITFTHGTIVDIYTAYEIKLWNYVDSSDPTLQNSLLGAVKLVKTLLLINSNIPGWYNIWFDMKGTFGLPSIGFNRKVIIFGVHWVHLHILIMIKQKF